tara:strand:+ start:1356 stop:1808 length:453 start_codon:yes stop_codon:yes gene_type:complete
MRNTGQMAGIFESVAALGNAHRGNNQRLELATGERYITGPTDLGSGVLLKTGNYANPIITVDSVTPHTGGSTLVVGAENELQDGSSFPLPLAANYTANTYINVELPTLYAAFTPSVIVSGADNINGDTNILFVGPTKIRLTSDGISQWRL